MKEQPVAMSLEEGIVPHLVLSQTDKGRYIGPGSETGNKSIVNSV